MTNDENFRSAESLFDIHGPESVLITDSGLDVVDTVVGYFEAKAAATRESADNSTAGWNDQTEEGRHWLAFGKAEEAKAAGYAEKAAAIKSGDFDKQAVAQDLRDGIDKITRTSEEAGLTPVVPGERIVSYIESLEK